MVALAKTAAREVAKTRSGPKHLLIHLVWLGAAAVFVAILARTYGLDLSPGFF